jgi:two-component system KDP operon response regulator KdpE
MTTNGWLQIVVFTLAVLLATKPLGLYEVWGINFIAQTHYLRIYMMQLRQKIEAEPTRPRLLITEPGVGYRLKTE